MSFPTPRHAAPSPTIMFVTQPPFGLDATSINAVNGNHRADTGHAPRGGDLFIRYGDGSLRNLTAEAGYGLSVGQEIAVREPSVHWSGNKALFSMVVGGTTPGNNAPVFWQIYEVTNLAPGQTAQITKLPQPSVSNNLSPIYGTDDRIIFTSDRPQNGNFGNYPALDEYQAEQTNTGLWSMAPDGSDLKLLDHSPSGDFSPLIASDGRVIFTRWDHLQRDTQTSDATRAAQFGAFNYPSEAGTQQLPYNDSFPEPLTQPAGAYLKGHHFSHFFPWQINEDGTNLETLNHVGRHELFQSFPSAHQGLPDFIAPAGRRTAIIQTQLKEDPNNPGYFVGTQPPDFGGHNSGQLIALRGDEATNADNMQVDYLTDPLSLQFYLLGIQTPPANHPGHFRNATPLSDSTLIAVHSDSPYRDKTNGGPLTSLYNFRLVQMLPGNPYYTKGARLIANGITKSVSYWDNSINQQVSYSGQLWELDPVEVRARQVPVKHSNALPAIEQQILSDELGGQAGIDEFQNYLQAHNLALVVSRNVTRRADKQQDYNLKIYGSATQSVEPGAVPLEIAFMQFLQADLLRGYTKFNAGRRPMPTTMHEGLLPVVANAPSSSVQLGSDGSMAALIPARRAVTWQMLGADGAPVVRERYWVTFAPGEMRTCTNCHGINQADVFGQPRPVNPPQALHALAAWYRDNIKSQSVLLTPTNAAFPANGGTGAVNITPIANWPAQSNASWLTITASNGATVNYTVAANPSPSARTGSLTIAYQTFNVTQAGTPAPTPTPTPLPTPTPTPLPTPTPTPLPTPTPTPTPANCTYTVQASGFIFGANGGNTTTNVTATSGCVWTVVSNTPWITVTTPSGNGNGTAAFLVAANTGPNNRSGSVTIAGKGVGIVQAGATGGACNYTLVDTSKIISTAGGTKSVIVVAPTGCAWAAASNVPWISISNPNNTGIAVLTYTVAANPGPSRTGTLTVAGQTYTVIQ